MTEVPIFLTEVIDHALVVIPQGDVSSLAADNVRRELSSLMERIRSDELEHVVVDFTELEFFGTSMLGAMQGFRKAAWANGGRVAVCNVSDVAREVLKVSRFDTLWPVYRSRADALAAVAKG